MPQAASALSEPRLCAVNVKLTIGVRFAGKRVLSGHPSSRRFLQVRRHDATGWRRTDVVIGDEYRISTSSKFTLRDRTYQGRVSQALPFCRSALSATFADIIH
jgi:hypothetical protein